MIIRVICIGILASLILVAGCNKPSEPVEPKIQVTTIGLNQLPQQFDTTRTFVNNFYPANPESILTGLVKSGIPFSQAWMPLYDAPCLYMRVLKPSITIELTKDDMRMIQYGFIRGVSFLGCSEHFKRYTLSN